MIQAPRPPLSENSKALLETLKNEKNICMNPNRTMAAMILCVLPTLIAYFAACGKYLSCHSPTTSVSKLITMAIKMNVVGLASGLLEFIIMVIKTNVFGVGTGLAVLIAAVLNRDLFIPVYVRTVPKILAIYQSCMLSYKGQNISYAEYAKLLHSALKAKTEIVSTDFIDYLERNKMFSQINTLIKGGVELHNFKETHKKFQNSHHYEAAVIIKQICDKYCKTDALRDALLQFFLGNYPEFQLELQKAFLKGYYIREQIRPNEATNDISYPESLNINKITIIE